MHCSRNRGFQTADPAHRHLRSSTTEPGGFTPSFREKEDTHQELASLARRLEAVENTRLSFTPTGTPQQASWSASKALVPKPFHATSPNNLDSSRRSEESPQKRQDGERDHSASLLMGLQKDGGLGDLLSSIEELESQMVSGGIEPSVVASIEATVSKLDLESDRSLVRSVKALLNAAKRAVAGVPRPSGGVPEVVITGSPSFATRESLDRTGGDVRVTSSAGDVRTMSSLGELGRHFVPDADSITPSPALSPLRARSTDLKPASLNVGALSRPVQRLLSNGRLVGNESPNNRGRPFKAYNSSSPPVRSHSPPTLGNAGSVVSPSGLRDSSVLKKTLTTPCSVLHNRPKESSVARSRRV